MKRLIAAAGLAKAAASTAACGGTHTSSPSPVTVTTTPAQVVTPVTPVTPVMSPTEMRQWVNAGQLDFYVYYAWQPPDKVSVMMYVKNTSGVPQTYRVDAQMLVDDQGRLFAPTPGTTVSSTSPPQGDQFDLNPGMTSGMLLLDYAVPPGTNLDQYTLVVHGSHTSIGSPIHLHEVVR